MADTDTSISICASLFFSIRVYFFNDTFDIMILPYHVAIELCNYFSGLTQTSVSTEPVHASDVAVTPVKNAEIVKQVDSLRVVIQVLESLKADAGHHQAKLNELEEREAQYKAELKQMEELYFWQQKQTELKNKEEAIKQIKELYVHNLYNLNEYMKIQ